MRHAIPVVLTWALAIGGAAIAADPADPAPTAAAAITYVSGESIYVDAGEREGLVVGSRLDLDGDGPAAVLVAVEVSAHRAVCRVESGDPAGATVGRRVRFAPAARAPAAREGVAEEAASRAERSRSDVHGRIGLRYLATRDGLNDASEFSSPGLDVRVDARSLFGSPWNAYLDVRARRVTRTGADGQDLDDDRSRVYRASVGWDRPGPGWRFAAGRQVAPELANVSLFDGVVAAWDGRRVGAGGFAGTQPDPVDWGTASDVEEAGAWFAVRSTAGAERRWGVNVGAVSSRQDGEVNRDFVFLQGRYGGRRVHVFAVQEVDLNRGWKKEEAGESSIEPTSTFVTVRVKAGEAVDLVAGFDNRRNVRLYRDRVTPVTEFDDAFRRGGWAGVRVRTGRHLRFGLTGRSSSGGTAGTATSYTADVGVVRLTRVDLGVTVRATRWDDDRLEGGLYSVRVSIDPVPGIGIAVEGGVRDETSQLNPELDDTVSWYGLDLDFDLARGLWATVSWESASGDFEDVDQVYATLAWRF